MFSALESFNSSVGPYKSGFLKYVPLVFTISLALEFVGMITLMIFSSKSTRDENIFYVSSVIYIMFSTIYFAWHALIKENAFELLALSLTSTILTVLGVDLSVIQTYAIYFKIIVSLLFIIFQLFFYFLCYRSYKHFRMALTHDLDQSVHVRKIMAVKTFEMFISMIKVDFLMYISILAAYFFYVLTMWDSFYIPGLIIGVIFTLCLIGHSFLGIRAVLAT